MDSGTKLPFQFDREEVKFKLRPAQARALRDAVARRLPSYAYVKDRSPTYITTVYFDTDEWDFYVAAKRDRQNNTKIRVKEYYYKHNGRNEVSTRCWVEIKKRVKGIVQKRRFSVHKYSLASLCHGADVSEDVIRSNPDIPPGQLLSIYRELEGILAGKPIRPKTIVNYRRYCFQEEEAALRITFDDRISFYAAPPYLYSNGCSALTREVLGLPVEEQQSVIVEIKYDCRGIPDWLREELASLDESDYSKFITGTREIVTRYRNGRSQPEEDFPREGNRRGSGEEDAARCEDARRSGDGLEGKGSV